MPQSYLGTRIKQIYLGEDIKRVYVGRDLVFSRSQKVTYYIDINANLKHEIEVNYGEDVTKKYTPLTPNTWDASWKFVGWKTDKSADASILNFKIMGVEPITLYAVFKQDIVRHFVSFDTNYKTESVPGTRYYNNGTLVNPSIKVPTGKICDGWTWRGWSAGSTKTANAPVALNNGDTLKEVTSSDTHYGLYYLTKRVTLTYNGNGSTSGNMISETKDRYWSASDTYVNPEFTLANCSYSKRGYLFSAWAQGNTSGTQRVAGTKVTLTNDTTFYAIWNQNQVKHIFNYQTPNMNQTAATKDAHPHGGVSYWSIDNNGYITFNTSIDVSNLSKIIVEFNHSSSSDGKVEFDVYLPSTSGFTDDDVNIVKSNYLGTTGYIVADWKNAITQEFAIPSNWTGNRYVTIAVKQVSGSDNHLTLWRVSYQ